jgi:1,4-alpha-glucan branching enzyme
MSMKTPLASPSQTDFDAILTARSHDPHGLLGRHEENGRPLLRVFRPYASSVALRVGNEDRPLQRAHAAGMFEWRDPLPVAKQCLLVALEDGAKIVFHDPYSFPATLTPDDLYLFNAGKLHQAYRSLGAHAMSIDGVDGVRFAVWAPNAGRVSVVGEFNRWDGRIHAMRSHGASGVWELFVPGLAPNNLYKFEIRNRRTGQISVKSDPYGNCFEMRPSTAARVVPATPYHWTDQAWLKQRGAWDWLHAPLNIYEVHPGSWRKHYDGRNYTYRDLATHLIPYVQEMGYTHIELLPISEHPLDESWGYQTTGYFAASSRFGSPDDLRFFIDACHQANIGVLLDWVPAHFPTDDFALARFDGTALYEHEDPRLGFHQDWGTHIFNYGRNEVRSFLLSSAHYWLSEFHIDGLRVDAVASMLYLDYSRKAGEWLPNKFGGRENLDAIDFLRELNVMVHEQFPGALTMAEESTAWPAVSRPTYLGGLGFSMKWNMGWMNDTLRYFSREPIYRRFHQNELTFGQLYAYSENFVLPFSHDEVVHGKSSLLDKMPGDAWQKFANLRLLLTYQATAPGKKLNFMGNEIGQGREWSEKRELDWNLLEFNFQRGVKQLAKDLNKLYLDNRALHELDFTQEGFQWIDCHDADQSIISFIRCGRNGAFVIVALNFTPIPRENYRIGVPQAGRYRELLNSDSIFYSGSNVHNGQGVVTQNKAWMDQPYSMLIKLPPLAGVILSNSI